MSSPAGVLGEGSGEGASVGGALMGGGTDTMVTCQINMKKMLGLGKYTKLQGIQQIKSPAGVLGIKGSGEGVDPGGVLLSSKDPTGMCHQHG